MSAFVPTNLLVVGGMLNPSNGLAAVIFWQWVNQSLNVAVNYRYVVLLLVTHFPSPSNLLT